MSPRLICNNHPDISIGSAKFPRESCAGIYSRHVQLPNPANYISIKFRMICLLAFRLPAFLVFVTAIVASRTNKKMFRINAGWVVAFMADAHARRNWALMDFIRKSMGVLGRSQCAVAISNLFGIYPAIRRFLCISPKSTGRAFVYIVAHFATHYPFCRNVFPAIGAFLAWIEMGWHKISYSMYWREYVQLS